LLLNALQGGVLPKKHSNGGGLFYDRNSYESREKEKPAKPSSSIFSSERDQ
jgi:hypothetical protein